MAIRNGRSNRRQRRCGDAPRRLVRSNGTRSGASSGWFCALSSCCKQARIRPVVLRDWRHVHGCRHPTINACFEHPHGVCAVGPAFSQAGPARAEGGARALPPHKLPQPRVRRKPVRTAASGSCGADRLRFRLRTPGTHGGSLPESQGKPHAPHRRHGLAPRPRRCRMGRCGRAHALRIRQLRRPLAGRDGSHFELCTARIQRPRGIRRHQPRHVGALPGRRLPRPLRAFWGGSAETANRWRFVVPGVRAIDLPVAPGDARARLVAFKGGITIPLHDHGGPEHIVVFTGALEERDGRFARGDISIRTAGETHQQRVAPGEPCVALVVNEGALRPLTLRGRLLLAIARD